MKKLEFKAENHNRLFGSGEEPEFAVEKMLELIRSGSFDARGIDDKPLEAELETDNYTLTLKPKEE